MARTVALLTLVMLGAWPTQAVAGGPPDDGNVIILGDLGETLGTGSLHAGHLAIDLVDGSDRFVTVQIEGSDPSLTRIQGVIVHGVLYPLVDDAILPAQAYARRFGLRLALRGARPIEAELQAGAR